VETPDVSADHATLQALLRAVYERFDEDRCLQIASSLTVTTLLAIVPVVAIVLTVVAAFPVFSPLIAQVQQFVIANLVPSSVDAVAVYAENFSRNAAGLTAAGILFLGVTAVMMMFTIEGAFNDIWRVTWQRGVLGRILVYGAALMVGPLMVGASLSLTSYLLTLSLNIVEAAAGVHSFLLKVVPLMLTAGSLSLLYFVVPNREVAARDAVIGGAIAGVLFEALKLGFAVYVTRFPSDQTVYGAFAVVPIFLLWIYLSWLVVLGGAVLVAVLPEWQRNAVGARYAPGGDFVHALRALELLWRLRRSNTAVATGRLHATVRLRVDRLEWILSVLLQAGCVVRTRSGGWQLSAGAAAMTVGEVYRRFVFDLDARNTADGTGEDLDARIRELAGHGAAGMDQTLAQFFGEDAAD
jgi:membrane protein